MGQIVQSVEYLTIDIDSGNSPVTTNLTKGQDETKCVPFYTKWLPATSSLPNDFRERQVKLEIIDNGGTAAVRASMPGKTDTDDHRLQIFVVEFKAAITVQQVDLDVTDTNSSNTATISSVGSTASAFLLYYYGFTHTVAVTSPNHAGAAITFNSTTEIQATRQQTTGNLDGIAYIVSCASGEFTVEHTGAISIASADKSVDTGITLLDKGLSKAFCITSYYVAEGGDDPRDGSMVGTLTSTTNFRVRRALAGTPAATATVHGQIVECQNDEWEVQRNDWTDDGTTNPDTISITAIDTAYSIVKNCCHIGGIYNLGLTDVASGLAVDDQAAAFDFNSTTVIGVDRETATSGHIVPWEVIDFTGTAASGAIINRVLTSSTVVTDPVPGYQLYQDRAANSNVTTFSEAMFLYYAFNRLAYENLSIDDAYLADRLLRRELSDVVSMGGAIELLQDRFAELSEAIAIEDDFIKSVELGGTPSTTYTRKKTDRVDTVVDNATATFLGIIERQKSDSLSLNDFEFLQWFRNRSVADQIGIANELLFMTQSKVRLDSMDIIDNVIVSEQRTRNITVIEAMQLTDNKRRTLQYIQDRILFDSFDLYEVRKWRTGSTLQPSVEIKTGIEER